VLPLGGQGDCSISVALLSKRPVAHGAELGVGDPKEQAVCKSQGAGGDLGSNELLWVGMCMSIYAFMGE